MSLSFILLIALSASMSFAVTMSVYRTGLPITLMLLAVFPWFLPLEWAIFTAACIHFVDYAVKFSVMKYRADLKGVLIFGISAMAGAWLGASFLTDLPGYSDFNIGRVSISPFFAVFFSMLVLSAIAEWLADVREILPQSIPRLMSGLLCGLVSGMSGVFESLKKIFYRSTQENFVQYSANTIVSSLFSDMIRIPVYLALIYRPQPNAGLKPVAYAAVIGAVLGIVYGLRYLKEIRQETLRYLTLISVFVSALGLLIKNVL